MPLAVTRGRACRAVPLPALPRPEVVGARQRVCGHPPSRPGGHQPPWPARWRGHAVSVSSTTQWTRLPRYHGALQITDRRSPPDPRSRLARPRDRGVSPRILGRNTHDRWGHDEVGARRGGARRGWRRGGGVISSRRASAVWRSAHGGRGAGERRRARRTTAARTATSRTRPPRRSSSGRLTAIGDEPLLLVHCSRRPRTCTAGSPSSGRPRSRSPR